MEVKTIIQTIGAIAKEESLQQIDHNILEGSLVLENTEPFPGYHGSNMPDDKAPLYIFLITPEKHSAEKITRVAHNIRKHYYQPFDASAGKICIENNTYYCIRLKDLDSYNRIAELQACFVDEGITFSKKRKINATGVIQLRKHFMLEEIAPGIYKDLEESHMHYLKIPRQIKWKLFKLVTSNVKNNVENNNFDAALGAFYLKDVTDVVRIYSQNLPLDALIKLRDKFSAELLRVEL
ncbi:MAG: hypothetical protein U0T82_05370 [Bacteroidales bacterium]